MEVKEVNKWKWEIEGSKSTTYEVIKRRDETFWCSCPSFKFNTYNCKHIDAVKEYEANKPTWEAFEKSRWIDSAFQPNEWEHYIQQGVGSNYEYWICWDFIGQVLFYRRRIEK